MVTFGGENLWKGEKNEYFFPKLQKNQTILFLYISFYGICFYGAAYFVCDISGNVRDLLYIAGDIGIDQLLHTIVHRSDFQFFFKVF